ncbi:MAG: hypothetical protein K0Q78_551, partial [Cellvibrio sp.]|nr:hypothetical protein [Cellvibrio sp.]
MLVVVDEDARLLTLELQIFPLITGLDAGVLP